jgi:hypothetical protein
MRRVEASMRKKGLNRKDFLKGSIAGLATLLLARVLKKKAHAMEPFTDVTYYDEPAIGQPGYAKRVAKLFKGTGLPEKANQT